MITASEARKLVKTQDQINLDIKQRFFNDFEINVEALSNLGKTQYPESVTIHLPEIMEMIVADLTEGGYTTEVDEKGTHLMIGWGKDGLVKPKKEETDDK